MRGNEFRTGGVHFGMDWQDRFCSLIFFGMEEYIKRTDINVQNKRKKLNKKPRDLSDAVVTFESNIIKQNLSHI